MQKTIGILYGGKSGEHEVSCQSAASISRHIDQNKYSLHMEQEDLDVQDLDRKDVCLGCWLHGGPF